MTYRPGKRSKEDGNDPLTVKPDLYSYSTAFRCKAVKLLARRGRVLQEAICGTEGGTELVPVWDRDLAEALLCQGEDCRMSLSS